ncbi:MAG: hypothetical protein L3J65_06375 [Robiginitomaculum sp.]|nr:hypothetical protein [Robiginitomaculum sp.]
MKIGRTFLVFASWLVMSAMLSGCQTLATQRALSNTDPEFVTITPDFETAGMVDARQFLSAELMSSNLHRVSPQVWNDGYANTYKIETPQYLYVVQGTERAKVRIREIEATQALRQRSTAAKAGKAVVERTVNLVETPVRIIDGVAGRFGAVKNPAQALMVIPSGAAEIVGNLGNGLKELGVTGWRIASGAAGTRCQGVAGCVSKAGEDIWSGVNSLVGKHAAAKEIHAELGTDPYTDNDVLQHQVDRLAYADAYTSTAVKIGYTWSNVRILDPLATGVGYYNNGEFVSAYEDAHKYRKRDKTLMRRWGVSEDNITKLYKSSAFTHRSRAQLTKAVATFGTDDYKARMVTEAASSPTRFVADSRLRVYQYLAGLSQTGQISAFVADLPAAVAVNTHGVMLLPFAADYLKWTPEIAPTIIHLAQVAGGKAEIHVLGKASPMFKQKAKALGVSVLEVAPTK